MSATEMNEARIAYSDNGTGEPVLLIHCSSASGTEWNSLCATLGGDFRSIAPDQWGCGQSDPWTGENAFTLAEEAAPILDIIQSIGVPVHLVGHSYGGGVALRIARERPYMIRSLTLIEPSAFHLLRYGGPADRALFGEIAKVAEAVRKAIAGSDSCAGMSRFVDYWNGEGAWMALPEQTRGKLARRLDKVVLDFQALFDEPADLEIYAALPHPTLVLCGDRSPAPSRRIVEMLASAMPSARAERIPGANHMSPITHPDEVNRAVRRHLLRHGAAHLPLAA